MGGHDAILRAFAKMLYLLASVTGWSAQF